MTRWLGRMERRALGGSALGGLGGCIVGLALAGLVASGCGDDEPSEPTTQLGVDDARPGDLVGVTADDGRRVVSWLHRTDGTIHELAIDEPDAAAASVGTIDVGIDSQQGGLLDQVVLADGRRVLAFTDPDNDLVVAAWSDGETTILLNAGPAGNGAIGGKLALTDTQDQVLVSIGRNVDWYDESFATEFAADASEEFGRAVGDQGALLRLTITDDSDPTITSFGHTNPWAVIVSADGEIWVWDNAAGPDPDDPDVDDVERFGRVDLTADRARLTRSAAPDRAPTDIVELPDGRLAVCGFLDNELRAYEVIDTDLGARTGLERAGTIMSCNTGAAVFADGTIVTAAQTVDGESLQILRP